MTRLALSLIGWVLLVAGPALAQPQCGPQDEMVAMLADRYNEHPQSAGFNSAGLLVTTFAGADGSWTLTITSPTGHMCLVATGVAFVRFTVDLGEPA